MNALDQRLLQAHAADDRLALVPLYTQAADTAPDLDAACFFLTHAYVYALEQNHADARALHARLVAQGREE
ncbi:hypothetical protein SuNHUV7_29610 (plasmid) [Pseudoseohaeicola sp. NH-UV-7]|jgi:hypothetical protein|uniref:hypothetical protein n=1 Tax=unclassified Sulfitobacter TaxID=196795 RepID=UPI000E0C6B60|nr:hypothetical protein [Sulfitobacter sp. JL08]AXI55251.1 hypothetical protein C1J05_12735 [Sulfitobacter sp. JL08]